MGRKKSTCKSKSVMLNSASFCKPNVALDYSSEDESSICRLRKSNSLIGDGAVHNAESSSKALMHLMKGFTLAERRLDDLHLELMELFNDSQADEEMVTHLLEQCQMIVRKSEVTFETIQSDKSLTDNAKVRAKRRWCSVQERLSEIQGYPKCMKRMPVNAT